MLLGEKELHMKKERKGTFREQDKEPVIERLAQLIRRHPSRSAAARAWGININTLNSYFKSESNPPMPRENLLLRIAESEGVSLQWLKTGLDESPKKPINVGDFGDDLSEMLSFLTQEERRQLTSVLARKGVETILYLLDEDSIGKESGFDKHMNSKEKPTHSFDAVTEEFLAVLSRVSQDQREKLLAVIYARGIASLLSLSDDLNIKILQLPHEEKERLMRLHGDIKKVASDGSEVASEESLTSEHKWAV